MSGDSTQDAKQVEWREVPGWPGFRASSEGNVQTQWVPGEKFVKGHKHRRARIGTEWSPVKIYRNADGYLVFNIPPPAVPPGKSAGGRVHAFVCLAFHGLPQPGQEVRHFPDRDIANNRPENLSWATHLENLKDRHVHGTIPRGENHQFSKLTVEKVFEIHRLYARRVGPKEIALRVGANQSNVSNIVAFRAWAWLRPQVELMLATERAAAS